MNQKIQIIRGISACAVIMIHSNARGITGIAIRPFINFAVPMFIFCSGYLTKSKYNDYKQFYIKRLTKIMIPYILWTLIYTILFNNYNNLCINLLTANAIRPFYFLFVYAQFVILTPIIIKLIYSKYQQLGWWITPISIFIIQYICNFLGIQLGFPFPSTLFPV